MSVRIKAPIVVAAFLFALVGLVLTVVLRATVLDAEATDHSDAVACGKRLLAAISVAGADQLGRTVDYANWDDMRRQSQHPDDGFAATNLDPLTLFRQRFAHAVVTQPDGTPVTSVATRSARPEPVPPLAAASNLLRGDPELRRLIERQGQCVMVRSVAGQPMLCAVSTILTSRRTGPPTGFLLTLWPLDGQELRRVALQSGVASEALPPDSHDLPPSVRQWLATRPGRTAQLLLAEGPQTVGYQPLLDEQGQAAAVLRYESPRSALARSRSSMVALAAILLLLAAAAAVGSMLALDRLVLSRLARLRQFVDQIDVDVPLAMVAPEAGRHDELAALGQALNDLLARQAEQQSRSARAESRLMALAHSACELLATPDAPNLQLFIDGIGLASGADCVRVFLKAADGDGNLCWDEVAAWYQPGVEAVGPMVKGARFESVEQQWPNRPRQQRLVHAKRESLQSAERAWWKQQGLRAAAVLPIELDDEIIGLVGFGRMVDDTLFGATDLDYLRSVVASLGQALRGQRALAALVASDALYRLVVDNVNDVIWTCNLDGLFTYVSPSIYDLRGWRPDEIIGHQRLEDALSPASLAIAADALQRNVAALLSGGTVPAQAFELEQPCRDGSMIWTESHVRPLLDETGNPIGFIGVTRDVTERRASQAEHTLLTTRLRQAAKMEAVGQLAGGVAHDFNNMLTAITGYAELVRSELPAGSTAEADLEEVLRAVQRASELTRQLLAFSRHESSLPRTIDLNSLVLGMDRMLRRLVPASTALVTQTSPTPCVVHADPGHLEQIVMNLVVNSSQAMPAGGTVTVRTSVVDLHDVTFDNEVDRVSGSHILLEVLDDGPGMDEATRQRAFEPFFTTKPTGVGTGLGLAVVFGLARQNGGHVQCDSAPGAGTVLSVYLPRGVAGVTPEADAPQDEPADCGTETVLVVEDEPHVLQLVERVLRSHGYTVQVAASGEQALTLLDDPSLSIDLLLSDVIMPGCSGADLAAMARARNDRLPVLLMSGYTGSALAAMGASLASFEMLPKPFTAAALTRAVRRTLDRPRADRPRPAGSSR